MMQPKKRSLGHKSGSLSFAQLLWAHSGFDGPSLRPFLPIYVIFGACKTCLSGTFAKLSIWQRNAGRSDLLRKSQPFLAKQIQK